MDHEEQGNQDAQVPPPILNAFQNEFIEPLEILSTIGRLQAEEERRRNAGLAIIVAPTLNNPDLPAQLAAEHAARPSTPPPPAYRRPVTVAQLDFDRRIQREDKDGKLTPAESFRLQGYVAEETLKELSMRDKDTQRRKKAKYEE